MESLAADDLQRIGPFLLQGRLGAGGMGQVYLGVGADGTPAAVKVVHSRFAADPSFRQRFAREIEVARSVHGPWVAALLDGDARAPRPWLATEYVDAPPLDRVVEDDGPLPEHALVALAHRLAEALAQLHAQGVVHRDLKPSNVLVADDGAKLIDFGVARAIDATMITQTGVVVGTPAFMSPEQAAGSEIGPPSDVFSLASVLVYAATGHGPFGHTANALAMLRRVSDDQPDLDGIPGPLRTVLEPCFAKDPADRPTAAALATGLSADALAAPSPLDPWDPTEIGPYRLLGRIGAGAMGHVYLGEAAAGARLAAVKVVHEQYAADRRFRERFAREIATARAVRGPRIAELLDADPDARIPWLATEYIPGPSLEQAVAERGALSEHEALRLAAGLVEALDAPHGRGVVHRDLKPSNVLVGGDGPVLIDFGIARALEETSLTETGGVLGAPGYMSPEQAMGEEAGPPSDMFSFAAVVVFAATGRGPFGTSETPLALLRRVVDEEPDLSHLPQSLLDIVGPCLSKRPAGRPTASETLERLSRHTTTTGVGETKLLTLSEPDARHEPRSGERGPRPLRRRALLVGAVVTGMVGTVLAGRSLLDVEGTPTRPPRWTTGDGAVAMTAAGRTAYAAGRGGVVRALDAAGGAARWTHTPRRTQDLPPTLRSTPSTCYVHDVDLSALDAESGRSRWTKESTSVVHATDEQVICLARETVGEWWSRYETRQVVQGLDPGSAATRWTFGLDAGEGLEGVPVLETAGRLHLRSGSRIFALDASTGALLWEQPAPDPGKFHWTASGAGLFYLTSREVVGLDPGTGASSWRHALPYEPVRQLVATDQSVLVADRAALVAWDARTGAQQWRVEQPGSNRSQYRSESWSIGVTDPLVATEDAAILVERSDAKSYRVSARSTRNGDTLWVTPLDAPADSTSVGFDLALGTDNVYVRPRTGTWNTPFPVHAISLT